MLKFLAPLVLVLAMCDGGTTPNATDAQCRVDKSHKYLVTTCHALQKHGWKQRARQFCDDNYNPGWRYGSWTKKDGAGSVAAGLCKTWPIARGVEVARA